MRKDQREMAADLVAARQRFEAWRADRVRGARIPEELWALAVDMAAQYGLGRAVSALRLDYYSLQRRVRAAGREVAERQRRTTRGPAKAAGSAGSPPLPMTGGRETFIQFPPLGMSSPSCRLELQTPAGASLRLELVGASIADTMLLTRAIWSQL